MLHIGFLKSVLHYTFLNKAATDYIIKYNPSLGMWHS